MTKPATPRSRSWPVTLAVAAASIVYFCCAFLPTSRAIRKAHDETRARDEFIAAATNLPAELIEIQKQLDRSTEYAALWKARLPAATALPAVLERMTRQADLAGARTTRFEPQPATELAGLRTIPILFHVQGSYQQVCRMLAELERLPERIWIDDLHLDASGENGQAEAGQDVRCELKLTIFADNSEKSD